MGVRILHDTDQGQAALYCSTSDWAFGPVFYENPDDHAASAADMAESFVDWLPQDARSYSDHELERKYGEWGRLEKCWDHIAVKPCAKCAERDAECRQCGEPVESPGLCAECQKEAPRG